MTSHPASTRNTSEAAEAGILAGFIASLGAVLIGIIAAGTFQGRGFLTPLYDISALFEPGVAELSVRSAEAGEPFYIVKEPFAFGLIMSLAVGGAFGALFALLARALRPRGRMALLLGGAYGLLLTALMTVVILPLTASVMQAPALDLIAERTGLATYTLELVGYGVLLGLWCNRRPGDLGLPPEAARDSPESSPELGQPPPSA